MSEREFVRPVWRNGNAFARALPEPCVSEQIISVLVKNKDPDIPLKTPSIDAKGEAEQHHASLESDLRIIDFGHHSYWIVMLVLCTIFLLCEFGLVVWFAKGHARLEMFQFALIVCLVGLLVLLVVYLVVSLLLHGHPKLPAPLLRIPTGVFHTLPVFWVSIFTVLLNAYVVCATGNSSSPFLPALLTASLVTLSLPRENSKLVLLLAVIALTVGLYGAARTSPVSIDVVEEWGGQQLATKLNILTFLFSGLSVVILRGIANHKVAK